jgi:plastocyanin/mono/diheme cytochrome c family protein
MNRDKLAASILILPMLLGVVGIAWYGRVAFPGASEDDAVVFNLTGVAGSGVWTLEEVNGLNYWWKRFDPATLSVREGDRVVVNLRSADLFHRFYIPAFQVGPIDVEPGHMATVRFVADRPGVFQYYCTSMCGTCHFYMRGWLVVTAEGEVVVEPPPVACTLCLPDAGPPPPRGELVDFGEYLYRSKGCVTCHGPEGRGGVTNLNSASVTVPRHDTTARKLFLNEIDDAEAFIETVGLVEDLDSLDDPPDVSLFQVVHARFDNAKQIIREGRFTARLDPSGPAPPLQMPAWELLIDERDMDALLAYFVSLYPWEEESG